jgi:hypothetical protein
MHWITILSSENGNGNYVRMRNLRCDSYCKLFIVSVVGTVNGITIDDFLEDNVEKIENHAFKGICWNNMTSDLNVQDPFIHGTVVFRGYIFPKEIMLKSSDMALLAKAYPKFLKRYRSDRCGSFFMVGERQSDMASRSMGSASIGGHDYHDKSSMDTLLVPIASRLTNVLMTQTLHVQDMSGQVIIPLIKKYIRENRKRKGLRKEINSSDISPYTIITHPMFVRYPGYMEAFTNCSHVDTTDKTNEEQGELLSAYVLSQGNECLNKYFDAMRRSFSDVLNNNCLPLCTTCAWTPIEIPEAYSFKHLSFFVICEAGICWDLSSDIFASGINVLGGTFFGSLVEHCTSCSLYSEEVSGWVTPICKGCGTNLAWGSSSGQRKLKEAMNTT